MAIIARENKWFDDKTQTFLDDETAMRTKGSIAPGAFMGPQQTKDQTYKQGQLVKQADGSYAKWNANAGSFVPASQAEVTAFTNPSAQAASNLSVLAPNSGLENPIPQYIQQGTTDPITGENSFNVEMQKVAENMQNPTGMTAQNTAIEEAIKSLGGTDAEKTMMAEIQRLIASGGREVADAAYNEAKMGFESDAERLRQKQAAELASRGLGMSTVVNDVQSETNRDLGENLYKSFWTSQLAGRTAADAAMGRGVTLAQNMDPSERAIALSGMGINQANIASKARSDYGATADKQANHALLNLGVQNAAWDKKAENAKYLFNLPFATNAAGNNAQNAGVNATSSAFQGAAQAFANQQKDTGSLIGSVLTNAFGKK